MPAYVIVDISIYDPKVFEEYKKLTPSILAAFDGKFVARGGAIVPLEGDWNPERLTLIEFPSVERAREWWNSPAYTEALAIRQRSAKTNMIIVESL